MKISIKNFQSISDIEVEADKLTAIIGPSDRGKSAFIRAIKAAFFNAKGTAFVKDGAEAASVSIEDAGFTLLWEKGDKVNKQTLNGKVFSKIGTTSPPEVAEATKVRDLTVGDLVISPQIQTQHDYPFILNKPDPQISSAISFLSKTKRVLEASKFCASELKDTREKLKYKREELVSLGDKIKTVKPLVDTNQVTHQALDSLKNGIGETEKTLFSLESYSTLVTSTNLISESLASVSKDIKIPDIEAFTLCGSIETFMATSFVQTLETPGTTRFVELEPSFALLSSIEDYLKIAHLINIETPDIVSISTDSVDKAFKEISQIETFLIATSELAKVSDNLESLSSELAETQAQIMKLEKELGVCPLCSSKFSEHEAH